jgi:ABC-type glycerol-3-phosphate transport system permease component
MIETTTAPRRAAPAAAPAPKRRSRLKRLSPLQLIGVAVLCLIGLVYLYPILWLADSAFRPAVEIFQHPPLLFRDFERGITEYTLGSMKLALYAPWRVGAWFVVSVFVTLAGVALSLLLSSLTAYAFAYLDFPGRGFLFAFILATMMLPLTTMISPGFSLIVDIGLYKSLWAVIIPYSISAFGVFMMRQYYIKIPRSFMESAKVEGANHLRIWWSIILPLSKPALAALAIIQFRAIWNDFLFPLIVLDSEKGRTLPIAIKVMDSQNFNKPYEGIIAAGFLTAIVPMLFFLIFQRQFIEGLAGGMKE